MRCSLRSPHLRRHRHRHPCRPPRAGLASAARAAAPRSAAAAGGASAGQYAHRGAELLRAPARASRSGQTVTARLAVRRRALAQLWRSGR